MNKLLMDNVMFSFGLLAGILMQLAIGLITGIFQAFVIFIIGLVISNIGLIIYNIFLATWRKK